ncbi:MAG TPA: DUF4382 domain-containing protein [Terriglobales bacterium]|nr:DUF4382 domain-containing protein [Terriglobales bacterium]
MKTRTVSVLLLIVALGVIGAFVACSSSGSSSGTTGKVSVSLSDPPTCSGPNGAFTSIIVTISDVQIHQSSSAGPNDPGWVDLTPNLKNAPQQVDLLGQANNDCFLASLGSNTDLQAGTYQQIRVILSNNSPTTGNSNPCGGNTANCVVLKSNGQAYPLNLSSETQTGIKIPSGQLTGGQFTIGQGEVKDLNIDFDACASVVTQGAGQYRLKPVLHAGEMSLTSAPVSGTLVDSATMNPVAGATAIVALEQKDGNGIDRVKMQVSPDPTTGNFVLCPVPDGTYDVVAVMVGPTGTAYAATITTGVQRGQALGKIPMVAQSGTSTTDASLTGAVTTTTGSAATPADITLFAMQQVTLSGSNVKVIIPLAQQQSSTASVTTASGSCGANKDCANYTLAVPAMWPNIGAALSNSYTQDTTTTPIKYIVGGTAFVPQSGSTPDCTPSEVLVSTANGGGDLTVTAGATSTAASMDFTACQLVQ